MMGWQTPVMTDVDEFRDERCIAKLTELEDGSPIRPSRPGRGQHSTGTFVSLKAGGRAMPWESEKAELPAITLCEVSSPVMRLLAQPHCLEMRVKGRPRPLIYFPDLLATVDRAFAETLEAGRPFALAASEWQPAPGQFRGTRQLVVEVKDDDDPRNDDDEYEAKLELAAEIYRRLGLCFLTIVRSDDLDCGYPSTITDIAIDRFTRVSTSDVSRATACIGANGGSAPLKEVSAAMGEGVLGRAKLSALHVRRVVSIDVSKPLQPSSPVQLVGDGHAISWR
jgi:hypothetical protein